MHNDVLLLIQFLGCFGRVQLAADKPSTSTANQNTLETPTATTSTQLTEDESSSSPLSPQDEIKQKFLVQMPDDFFKFWEFAKSINGKNPSG
jgi:hypothetical protein